MSRFKNWKYPKFKKKVSNLYETKYSWNVSYLKGLKMGKNVDIGAFTYINARYGVIIEDNVQIGSHCSIYSHDSIDEVRKHIVTKGKVILKKGCCVGSHSIILPGVVVEEGQLIKSRALLYVKL